MIILQAPNGNLGKALIRATHHYWPDQFNYTGIGSWKHDTFLPDLYLPNPSRLTDQDSSTLTDLLGRPSIVLVADINIIPSLILHQIPDGKKFRIHLDTRDKVIRNTFCAWLSDISVKKDHAETNDAEIDFYQNLWRQLCVHLLQAPSSNQGTVIIDMHSKDNIMGFLQAVKTEYSLGDSAVSDWDYDTYLSSLNELTQAPVLAFPEQFENFSDVCSIIFDVNNDHMDFRQALDAAQQQKFKTVMDFFIEKLDFWRFDESYWTRV